MLADGKGGELTFGHVIGGGDILAPHDDDAVVQADERAVLPVPSIDNLARLPKRQDTDGHRAVVVPVGLLGIQDIVPVEVGEAIKLAYDGRDPGAFGLKSEDHGNPFPTGGYHES